MPIAPTTAGSRTVIYGSSDDLLEVASTDMRDEEFANSQEDGCWIATSAGQLIRCTADSDGLWGFRVVDYGGQPENQIEILPARGEDEPRDAEDCPGYSAKVVIMQPLRWVLVTEQPALIAK